MDEGYISMSTKPTLWQRLTTHPKCHEYIQCMAEIDRIMKDPAVNLQYENRFTRAEYGMEYGHSPYSVVLSEGRNHILRCTPDGKNCVMAECVDGNGRVLDCLVKYRSK